MIIRSQDKESIINFDRVDTVRLSRCTEKGVIKEHYQTNIFYETTDTRGLLGTYSTEEKAIKVLDMIQGAYCRMKSCDVSMCGIAVAISKQSDDIANRFIEESRNIHVFQMPSDEEVEV